MADTERKQEFPDADYLKATVGDTLKVLLAKVSTTKRLLLLTATCVFPGHTRVRSFQLAVSLVQGQ